MKKMFKKVRREENNLVYETAIKTYTHQEKGIEIKLACMDHVAKKEYFQKMFNTMDSLEKILYECTGIGNLTKKQEKSRANQTGKSFRDAMVNYAHALDLCFQLEIIPTESYGKNWEHCDIVKAEEVERLTNSPEELKYLEQQIALTNRFATRAKEKPGEKEEQLYTQAVLLEMQQGSNTEELYENLEVILDYRNELVKKRIKEVIDKQDTKNFGIMYGVCHMFEITDFLESLGFELKQEEWVEAWRVKNLSTEEKIVFRF